jgi:hypothetical protein
VSSEASTQTCSLPLLFASGIRAMDLAQIFDELVEFLAFELLAADGAEEGGEGLHDTGVIGDVCGNFLTGESGDKPGGLRAGRLSPFPCSCRSIERSPCQQVPHSRGR